MFREIINEIGINIKAYIKARTKLNNSDTDMAYLDYDKIESNLIIRNRLPGDRFKPLGAWVLKN